MRELPVCPAFPLVALVGPEGGGWFRLVPVARSWR